MKVQGYFNSCNKLAQEYKERLNSYYEQLKKIRENDKDTGNQSTNKLTQFNSTELNTKFDEVLNKYNNITQQKLGLKTKLKQVTGIKDSDLKVDESAPANAGVKKSLELEEKIEKKRKQFILSQTGDESSLKNHRYKQIETEKNLNLDSDSNGRDDLEKDTKDNVKNNDKFKLNPLPKQIQNPGLVDSKENEEVKNEEIFPPQQLHPPQGESNNENSDLNFGNAPQPVQQRKQEQPPPQAPVDVKEQENKQGNVPLVKPVHAVGENVAKTYEKAESERVDAKKLTLEEDEKGDQNLDNNEEIDTKNEKDANMNGDDSEREAGQDISLKDQQDSEEGLQEHVLNSNELENKK